jgi:hypothetical protein
MPRPSPLQAHPWHGIPAGDLAPDVVNVFIELVPTDTVKYEVDKASGHLKLDRPQMFSSLCPAPYGFIPRTWCRTRSPRSPWKPPRRRGVTHRAATVVYRVLTEAAHQPTARSPPAARPIAGAMFDRSGRRKLIASCSRTRRTGMTESRGAAELSTGYAPYILTLPKLRIPRIRRPAAPCRQITHV